MAAFVAFGFWFFGQRTSKDAVLRLEVDPTVRGHGVALPRGLLTALRGTVRDGEAVQVATFVVPLPGGLEGPLSPPIGLHLGRGQYQVEVAAEGPERVAVKLIGSFEIEGDGDVRASLRGAE